MLQISVYPGFLYNIPFFAVVVLSCFSQVLGPPKVSGSIDYKVKILMPESLDKLCCIQYNGIAISNIPGAFVAYYRVRGAHVSFIDLHLYNAFCSLLHCGRLSCALYGAWQGQALPLRPLKQQWGSDQRSGDPCGRQVRCDRQVPCRAKISRALMHPHSRVTLSSKEDRYV
jgi:hypothetical protein